MKESNSKKDEMIISLLGRLVFPEEKLRSMVAKNKRNPDAYLRGYNACDGTRTVTEIAKIIGVNQSTLNPIINEWEVQGIIYEVESNRGKTYKRLYKISGVKEKVVALESMEKKQNNLDVEAQEETPELSSYPEEKRGENQNE
jgi:transposase-like protein